MRYTAIALLSVLCLGPACKPAANKAASLEENPSSSVPSERLVDDPSAGNGAMTDRHSRVTAVDPNGIGASAPGAATVGPAGAGAGQGGSDGGRSLGDR